MPAPPRVSKVSSQFCRPTAVLYPFLLKEASAVPAGLDLLLAVPGTCFAACRATFIRAYGAGALRLFVDVSNGNWDSDALDDKLETYGENSLYRRQLIRILGVPRRHCSALRNNCLARNDRWLNRGESMRTSLDHHARAGKGDRILS
jgi:hypothetical protein